MNFRSKLHVVRSIFGMLVVLTVSSVAVREFPVHTQRGLLKPHARRAVCGCKRAPAEECWSTPSNQTPRVLAGVEMPLCRKCVYRSTLAQRIKTFKELEPQCVSNKIINEMTRFMEKYYQYGYCLRNNAMFAQSLPLELSSMCVVVFCGNPVWRINYSNPKKGEVSKKNVKPEGYFYHVMLYVPCDKVFIDMDGYNPFIGTNSFVAPQETYLSHLGPEGSPVNTTMFKIIKTGSAASSVLPQNPNKTYGDVLEGIISAKGRAPFEKKNTCVLLRGIGVIRYKALPEALDELREL